MAEAKTKAKLKARKVRRKIETAPIYYQVEINDWSYPYSFGIGYKPDGSEPYRDYRHLHLMGRLVAPETVKAQSVRVSLIADPNLNLANRARHRPTAIGRIELYRGAFDAFLSIPEDALPSLMTALAAGRMKFASLEGERLHYGKGDVRDVIFDVTLD